jgi:23S rRNA G2445 N2-methylase RlmL
MPSSSRLFALTTAGLESVGASEIASFAQATIHDIGYRRIAFGWNGSLKPLLGLRTVDDLFVDLGVWANIGHRRDELARLSHLAQYLDPSPAGTHCCSVRVVPHRPSFAVSASFVGRRNYATDEIRQAIARGIRSTTGWPYLERDDAADISIRIFIEHDRAYVGMRLGKTPLHERPYRTEHRGGALKPTIAAAMLHLTGPRPGMRSIDPCCGTGTIPIEAARAGLLALGFDRDECALEIAKRQGEAAGLSIGWMQASAERVPLGDASVDRVISNLPWGRQTRVHGCLSTFYARCVAELLRVLTPGGRLALLVEDPRLIHPPHHSTLQHINISLYGRRPTIVLINP